MKYGGPFRSLHRWLTVVSLLFLAVLSSCSDKALPDDHSSIPADSVTRANVDFMRDCGILLARAKKMDSTLLQQIETDRTLANEAIAVFTDYASYCHNDTVSPVYLIKTAQVAKAIDNIPQAKVVLDECIQRYPDFKGKPAALFFLAQLYDEPGYLNDESEAARLYRRILEDHPESEWALSAKGALQFIGKSDEEMLKEFEKMNKRK